MSHPIIPCLGRITVRMLFELFGEFFDYLRRFVIAALDVVSDEHELPGKIASRQRSLQTFNEWNNTLSASVTKDYE